MNLTADQKARLIELASIAKAKWTMPKGCRSPRSVQAVDLELVGLGFAEIRLGRFGELSITEAGTAALEP